MSGRKNVLTPIHSIVNGDMTTTLTSLITNIQYLDNVCVQLNFTGTPTGNFYVQTSLDGLNWINLNLSPTPLASGSADQILLDLGNLSFPQIRVQYVPTSGSGTLNMYLGAKSL